MLRDPWWSGKLCCLPGGSADYRYGCLLLLGLSLLPTASLADSLVPSLLPACPACLQLRAVRKLRHQRDPCSMGVLCLIRGGVDGLGVLQVLFLIRFFLYPSHSPSSNLALTITITTTRTLTMTQIRCSDSSSLDHKNQIL
jgi:hypothetical protein